MKKQTFDKGMAVFVKQFPEKLIDMDIAWQYLSDLGDQVFLGAISKIVMTKQDVNRSTNLIALVREFAIPEIPQAGEAWGEVLRKIQTVGSYGAPQFSSQVIQKAVDCIGWKTLCMSENIAIERAHFLKIYETFEKRQRIDDLTCDYKQIEHEKAKQIVAYAKT
jgi:hypothetical protein